MRCRGVGDIGIDGWGSIQMIDGFGFGFGLRLFFRQSSYARRYFCIDGVGSGWVHSVLCSLPSVNGKGSFLHVFFLFYVQKL